MEASERSWFALLGVFGFSMLTVACGSDSASDSEEAGGTGSSGGVASGGGSSGGVLSSGGTSTGAGGGSGGSNTSGSGGTGEAGGSSPVMGGPGCGFDSAAFCATFDAPAAESSRGRAGELDVRYWSAGRMEPQSPSGNGTSLAIGPATIPECRGGLPAQVFPDQDSLICDANASIDSPHLLTASAAQNYGQNSYRIRQPFDFAGRTGKIVLDAEAYLTNSLLGWISVEVTKEPTAVASFGVGAPGTFNDEGAIMPRNGATFEFQDRCDGVAEPPATSLRMINLYHDYVPITLVPPERNCVVGAQGKLNHIEIDISETHVDVYLSSASNDGKTFEEAKLLFSTDLDLGFSRGYVSISTHNHATLKYSEGNSMDAWVARFDNVGFDGPVVTNWREYEVPDSLKPSTDGEIDVGYRVPGIDGVSSPLKFSNVDPSGATAAQVAYSIWYPPDYASPGPYSDYLLMYRLNGGEWVNKPFGADELAIFTEGHCQGAIAQFIDLDPSTLVSGDNIIEFTSDKIGQGYPPVIANMDLALTTE